MPVWLYVRLYPASAVSKFNTPLVLFISNGLRLIEVRLCFAKVAQTNQKAEWFIVNFTPEGKEVNIPPTARHRIHANAYKHDGICTRTVRAVISITCPRYTSESHTTNTHTFEMSGLKGSFLCNRRSVDTQGSQSRQFLMSNAGYVNTLDITSEKSKTTNCNLYFWNNPRNYWSSSTL